MAVLPPSSPPSAPPGAKPGAAVVPLRPPHGKHKHKKNGHDEAEHGGADEGDSNWIVSYADMMTLLCVFFIIMYSLSNPDPRKYEEMKKETTEYFGGAYKLPYNDLVEKIKGVIKQEGLEKVVTIESDESGVSATFHGTVFFDSGKAELLPEGTQLLTKMGAVIKQEAPGFKIVVEGHTDDVPISSPIFPSNWELSGSRASRVIRLFETMGFDRKLLTAIGYADTRPQLSNRDEKGTPLPFNQQQNRRVILRVLKGDLPK